ncbi:MAG TPA: DMT family transporter [Planctomycetaceae bacterium]|jgi:drug/metabolite transporter (DMT)-like permease
MPYVWFIFISLIWGSSFILMKRGTAWLSPVEVAAWRVIGGAALLAILWWRTPRRRALTRRDCPAVIFVVLFGFAWPFSIQPYLVGRAGSAFIGMMVSFTPLLTVVASIPLLKVLPARRQLLGVLGALVFMGLLIREGVTRQIKPIDLALALTVPLCYALTNTLIRKSLSHVAALELSLVSLTAAGIILFSTSMMIPFERPQVAGHAVWTAIAAVAFLGIVGTGVATFLFNRLIQEQGPLFAGMATNLSPIGALMLGWLDAEHVSASQIAALAGLLCMVAIVQFGAVRQLRDA